MEPSTILSCLSEDSTRWEALTQKQASKEDRAEAQLSTESVVEFYQSMTHGLQDVISLQAAIDLSKAVSDEVETYHHCEFQAAVAAIVLSNSSQFTVVVSPTGSGKTWI